MTDIKSLDEQYNDILNNLELIIYSLKTEEDFNNLIQPYIQKGYNGFAILKHPYISVLESSRFRSDYTDQHIDRYRKLFLHVDQITNEYVLMITGNKMILVTNKNFHDYSYIHCFYHKRIENVSKNEIDCLKDEIKKLNSVIEEMYYAPGMPGFNKTSISFRKNVALTESINYERKRRRISF